MIFGEKNRGIGIGIFSSRRRGVSARKRLDKKKKNRSLESKISREKKNRGFRGARGKMRNS